MATLTSRLVARVQSPPPPRSSDPIAFVRRQGSAVPGTVITGPDAWYAKDYAGTEKHIYRLTETDLVELDAAVAAVVASGIDIKVSPSPPIE